MNKKALLLSYLMGLIAVPSHSQSIAGHEGTLTITPSFVSGYISYDVRLENFSFQPTVEYFKWALSLELFADFLVVNKVYGSSDNEIDLSVCRTWNDSAKSIHNKTKRLPHIPQTHEDYSYY